jgi:hypothetical protein
MSSAKRHFRDVQLRPAKNHGYNAVAEVSSTGSHFVPRILHSLPMKIEKVEKGQTFSDHTVSSRRRGRSVQSMVQIGSEMWICIRYKQTKTNKKPFQLYI